MRLLQTGIAIILFASAFSCTDDSYIFSNKEEQAKISEYRGALLGQWVSDTEKDENLVLGIMQGEEGLMLHTPSGDKSIEAIETMGDLGMIMLLKNGPNSSKIMAKFKSYEKTTLLIMNPDGVDLGLNNQTQIILKKAKEETVLTASSND